MIAPSDTAQLPAKSEAEEARFLWPPLILVLVLLWIVPLSTSLGLDESGNYWVLKDGFHEALVRSQIWPGTPIIYDALVIAAKALGGNSEIVLRLPALLAGLCSLWILYLLGKRLLGPLAGMLACLVFASLRDVVYVASTVRPYTLAILFVLGAMYCLVRWIDTGALRFGLGYVALAALTIYAHYLFAPIFAVHAVYAAQYLRRSDSKVSPRLLLAAWLATGLLLLPLAADFLKVYSERQRHVYVLAPGVTDLLTSLFPPLLAGSIALGLLLLLVARRPLSVWGGPPGPGRPLGTAPRPASMFLASWILIPPAAIFTVSLLTDTSVFAERFYLSSAPAIALAAGAILRAIQPSQARLFLAGTLAICSILVLGVNENFERGTNDWRGAIAAVNKIVGSKQTPVLVVPGATQARRVEDILNPQMSAVLFAPLERYPVAGRLIRVPLELTPEAEPYLEQIVSTVLAGEREFLLVGLFSSDRYNAWLSGRCRSLGFEHRVVGYYGGIQVVMFERRS